MAATATTGSGGDAAARNEPMTAARLLELAADGNRYELIRGALVKMSPAGLLHGMVVDRIGRRIGNHVERRALGRCAAAETGFRLERDADTVRAPDYAFISHRRLAGREPSAGYSDVVPDLVVEVVSPHDRPAAVDGKIAMWLDAGVRLVWIVDPAKGTVTVRRSDGTARRYGAGDTLTGESVLPGFTCAVADIFAA